MIKKSKNKILASKLTNIKKRKWGGSKDLGGEAILRVVFIREKLFL